MIDEKRHNRIKAALQLRGSSLSAVARDLKVAPATVSTVSRGFRRSRRIEAKIASELGCKAEDLWPERYRQVAEETTMS
ncbi:helix-turn-helix domain-containing protein [Sphingomonas abietis]|uniref:Helix-turn-helix domain-containing protein n=1 Tax=Sphingomonas abietis TaxID=3012344 RepID=A0ABY7NSQ2_9SPHN|nr:helix-turn-helix domain-containing protein [Sphingomonas abietis]WBO22506.1 helix-turn-helix domain-containing protein [Sphingomonas abietis]